MATTTEVLLLFDFFFNICLYYMPNKNKNNISNCVVPLLLALFLIYVFLKPKYEMMNERDFDGPYWATSNKQFSDASNPFLSYKSNSLKLSNNITSYIVKTNNGFGLKNIYDGNVFNIDAKIRSTMVNSNDIITDGTYQKLRKARWVDFFSKFENTPGEIGYTIVIKDGKDVIQRNGTNRHLRIVNGVLKEHVKVNNDTLVLTEV